MNRESGLAALTMALRSKVATKSSIARDLKIDPSQVSRIASGQFRRMDGHALKVCKLAYILLFKDAASNSHAGLATNLQRKVGELMAISPQAAEALSQMLEVLVEDLSLRNIQTTKTTRLRKATP